MTFWLKRSLFTLFAIALLLAGGCCQRVATPEASLLREEASRSVDYADPANWVVLPAQSPETLKGVDIFYVYPTIFVSEEQPFMSWESSPLADKARLITRQQTAPFRSVGNIYAPFVRQGELTRVLKGLEVYPIATDNMQLGFRDVQDAFHYYLKHFNGGRPFILAGHSQGAFALLNLLKREFDNPALEKKLIAAYLFGCPISDADLVEAPHLKLATGERDLGVIVVWNTEAEDAGPSLFTNRPGTRCINPLSWRTDASDAPASMNRGAVFFDDAGNVAREVPNFCNARINPKTGALVVTPSIPGTYDIPLLGKGVYHIYDIYFFFRNIESNAHTRASTYFSPKP